MFADLKSKKIKPFAIISFVLAFFTFFCLGFSFTDNLIVYSFLAIAVLFVIAYSLIEDLHKRDFYYLSIVLIPLLIFTILFK